MRKKTTGLLFFVALFSVLTIAAGPNPPEPDFAITLEQGLPDEMVVGETYTVEVAVESDIPYNFAMAMPDFFYPGRYLVAQGPNRSGTGTQATLSVPFTAKSSTMGLPEMPELGVPEDHALVGVAVGIRYHGGVVVSDVFWFNVKVTE